MAKVKAHVSPEKKEEVKGIINDLNSNKTLMVVSVKGLPSKQFQEIKKKLRDKAKIKITKKSLLRRAMEESKIEGIRPLEEYVSDNCALLYTQEDAFFISGILSKEKSPKKAQAGQEAPNDIEVKAGPTELVPGPDITALSSAGLAPKVESGKIAITQDKVIVKEGEKISEEMASIMAKLDIIPFEVGLEPVAAYMDNKVYDEIKIDFEGTINELEEKYSKALAFAVEISYYAKETIDLMIAKAATHEKAISSLGENKEDSEEQQETKTEEKT